MSAWKTLGNIGGAALGIAFMLAISIGGCVLTFGSYGAAWEWLTREDEDGRLHVGALVLEYRLRDGTGERAGIERPFVVTEVHDDGMTIAGPLGTVRLDRRSLATFSLLIGGEERWYGARE